jgi:flagellar basal-body rod modification protein FlgD
MSEVAPASPIREAASTRGEANDLREMNMDHFLQLLISELQNQDPLDPMDNAAIVEQIGQIREISATDKLTDTLDAVLTGQNMATAASLIGKRIHALSDSADDVEGIVDRVSLESPEDGQSARSLRVHVGDHKIRLENIREIVTETTE